MYEIAKVKQKDEHMKNMTVENVSRIIVGQCQSMGVEIVGGNKSEGPRWGYSADEWLKQRNELEGAKVE